MTTGLVLSVMVLSILAGLLSGQVNYKGVSRRIRTYFKHTGAFTLVELLVVVAVIAVLAALLLPALRTAKDSAKRTACINNQRQIYLGYAMYVDDFNGHSVSPAECLGFIMMHNNYTVYPWCGFGTGNYFDMPVSLGQLVNRYVGDVSVFYCPDHPWSRRLFSTAKTQFDRVKQGLEPTADVWGTYVLRSPRWNACGTAWEWLPYVLGYSYNALASNFYHNFPGNPVVSSTGYVWGYLRTPQALIIDMGPMISGWGLEKIVVHQNKGIVVTYVDGVVKWVTLSESEEYDQGNYTYQYGFVHADRKYGQ